MDKPTPQVDYLFISDLHVSLGYDPERRAYHAREDFFFDDAFFRWLQWANGTCPPDRRWELVFVGDGFDFLPVDLEMVHRYFEARDRRWKELDPADRGQAVAYWRRQFGGDEHLPPHERVPDWIRWLFFEDDAREGRVRLTPAPRRELLTMAPEAIAPDWAVHLYGGLDPSIEEAAREIAPAFGLGRPLREPEVAFQVVEGEAPPRPERDRLQEETFEQRYGFLPTQAKSMARLYFIYRGHPVFFRALAWFVGQGHRVTFLRGNHDLELFWPGVQALLRRFVAREHPAAFDDRPSPPPLPDLDERITFRPGWFYYRPGLFYAEHGNQYEPINSCPNFLRPLLPTDPRLLNPPVGNVGVTTVVANMEDEYPEWENRGKHAVVIKELVRRYPHQAFLIVTRHVRDFLWMAQRLWQATQGEKQEPTEEDFRQYASSVGLPPETVRAIYYEWDPPLLVRHPLAWFLFSPGGHVLKALLVLLVAALAVGGGLLWYLVIAPFLASLIPPNFLSTTIGPALQLLGKILLWLLPPLALEAVRRSLARWYPHPLMYWAARRVHRHLRETDRHLRFYILGHDHKTDVRIVERKPDHKHVYYLNTGCWFPEFVEGTRRLQTLGQDVQFTFVRLVQRQEGVEADLLRWNDDAGRAEQQIVPPARPEE
ncbi:MAG TPA: hypothetical protein EYH30_06915 [Anaerolineales bacterium]|nr:hypothetical protein [Anaerolineae bacterium]HIQ01845.1 hypothetical protein [Anaerolineales bacterium]